MRNWCTYITENLDSGNYYFGKSYVKNIESGYNGSGNYIKNAKDKGCNLKTTILNTYDTEEEAYEAEAIIISCFIDKKKCKNMATDCFPKTYYGADHHGARAVIDVDTGKKWDTLKSLSKDIGVNNIRCYLNSGCDINGMNIAYLDEYISGNHDILKQERRIKSRESLLKRRRSNGVSESNKDKDRAHKIKWLLAHTSMMGKEIAGIFDVYPSVVSKIKHKTRWKDLEV